MGKRKPHFGGETYEAEYDLERLTTQLEDVRACMLDGKWRTLREISLATGHPEASISARLRDLRKERFGSHTVDLQPRGPRADGLVEYRVEAPAQPMTPSAKAGAEIRGAIPEEERSPEIVALLEELDDKAARERARPGSQLGLFRK